MIEQTFMIESAGGPIPCLLLSSEADQLAPEASLLLSFHTGCNNALFDPPYRQVVDAFLEAGHSVVSFDLPNHAERVNSYGAGIPGLCAAFLAGADPFAQFVSNGRACIDACLAQGIGARGKIMVCGVSRAAYCALRLAAADVRIHGGAAFCPVTDWRVLREFSEVKERPEVAALALHNWVDHLAGRPTYLAIGNQDQRVGTDLCLRFVLELLDHERLQGIEESCLELHLTPEQGHSLSEPWIRAGGEFLLRLCRAP